MVPEGERWGQCIANRAFKTRVIDLVLLRLPALLLAGHPKRRLIVDYREPVEYQFCPAAGAVRREAIPELPPMGEADLKFTRHASRRDGPPRRAAPCREPPRPPRAPLPRPPLLHWRP